MRAREFTENFAKRKKARSKRTC